MGVNENLFNFFYSFAGINWPLDWFIIFLGTYFGPILLLITIVYALRQSSFKSKFAILSFLSLALIIALLIIKTSHFALENPRPFAVLNFVPLISQNPTTSFPSGHTTFFVALALSIWVVNRKYGYWFFMGALLIGTSRIMAGVHWPIDIFGGILCGGLSAYIAYKIFPHKDLLVVKK